MFENDGACLAFDATFDIAFDTSDAIFSTIDATFDAGDATFLKMTAHV